MLYQGGRSELAGTIRALGPLMKTGQGLGECSDLRHSDLLMIYAQVEPHCGGELAHLHRIFDHLITGPKVRVRHVSIDRFHADVQFRREAPVQTQLFLAVVEPAFEGMKIDEPEIDGFLEFISVGTGQQYKGDMRLDNLESVDWVRKQLGSLQIVQQRSQAVRQCPGGSVVAELIVRRALCDPVVNDIDLALM